MGALCRRLCQGCSRVCGSMGLAHGASIAWACAGRSAWCSSQAEWKEGACARQHPCSTCRAGARLGLRVGPPGRPAYGCAPQQAPQRSCGAQGSTAKGPTEKVWRKGLGGHGSTLLAWCLTAGNSWWWRGRWGGISKARIWSTAHVPVQRCTAAQVVQVLVPRLQSGHASGVPDSALQPQPARTTCVAGGSLDGRAR